jgi:hypothetical protein
MFDEKVLFSVVSCCFLSFLLFFLCCIKNSLQVLSFAHDLSIRLPDKLAFKGSNETSHHQGATGVYAGLCVGDPELGDLTISEMSPEDIRAELKR